MARKIKPPDPPPSKAWLMSFGDTMTTLLAFFIVLCSLAENQTGANLHRGTGSFIEHMESGGLAGVFSGDKSARAIHLEATSPLYMVGNGEEEEPQGGSNRGPDDESNDIPSVDREQEQFMRCLNALEKWSNLDDTPAISGEMIYDFFDKLSEDAPYLPENFSRIATRVAPLLRRQTHRVELIVWATTPSDSARKRAVKQSSSIVAELIKQSGLSPEQALRITPVTRNWPHAKEKRPIMSVVIKRLSSATTKPNN